MKITVDTDQLDLIVSGADKLLVDKGTEKNLILLLDLQEQIEEMITKAQKVLEEKALKLNPNFKSVEGDFIKAHYRAYGQRYYIEEDKITQVPKEMYSKEIVTKYKVNADAVDDFVAEKGGLPFGIVAPPRVKSLKIVFKKSNEANKV